MLVQQIFRNPIATWVVIGFLAMALPIAREEPLLIAVLIGILAGAPASIVSSVYRWQLARSAKGWKAVTGVVERSIVEKRTSEDGSRYCPVVAYEYSYGGRRYHSQQLTLDLTPASVGFGDPSDADELCEGHPAGSAVTVFINPDKPSQAVLDRGLEMSGKATVWFVGVALTAALVCAFALF